MKLKPLKGVKIDKGTDMEEYSSIMDCVGYFNWKHEVQFFSYNSKTSKCYSFDSESTTKIEHLTAENEERDDWETYIFPNYYMTRKLKL